MPNEMPEWMTRPDEQLTPYQREIRPVLLKYVARMDTLFEKQYDSAKPLAKCDGNEEAFQLHKELCDKIREIQKRFHSR